MITRIASYIEALRERLAEQSADIARMVQDGRPGLEVAEAVTAMRDEVVLALWNRCAGEMEHAISTRACLLAVGGYAKRRLCPCSDVDLLLIVADRDPTPAAKSCEPFFRDLYDVGLDVGFSVREVERTWETAIQDPLFCTSLLQVRLLWGDESLLQDWRARFRRFLRRHSARLILDVSQARNRERAEFGDTVYLLQPNVKRSPGALRDVQFIEWMAALRFQETALEKPSQFDAVTEQEAAAIREAEDFLLRVRQRLHVKAGKAEDILSRAAQWSLAEAWGFSDGGGLLGVEKFMREYFRLTEQVDAVRARVFAHVDPRRRFRRAWGRVVARKVGPIARLAGSEIVLTRSARNQVPRSYLPLLSLMEAALKHDAEISPDVWHWLALHRDALPEEPSERERERFLRLLDGTTRLPSLLRHLHALRLLERFITAFGHARGLLQFNQYHKFTVDQHSLIALEHAVNMSRDSGLLGRTYSAVADKAILHAAILLHDLGKGYDEDHCIVGARIAEETARRFRLSEKRAEQLVYLVKNHLRMNHLALRRDLSDDKLVVDFAVEVGSPELLRMLYVLTAVDLMAVGPDNWTGWKADLLAELYQRAMRCISDSGDIVAMGGRILEERRREILAQPAVRELDSRLQRLVAALPEGYLLSADPERIAEDLKLMAGLGDQSVEIAAEFVPAAESMVWTVATRERIAEGVFHRLTGAFTSHGLSILSAQIHTLPGGLILDRFWVRDPFYRGEPPPDRLQQVREGLLRSLAASSRFEPVFRERWKPSHQALGDLPRAAVRVEIDNVSLPEFTIIEVFANDRAGLLYRIARTLFEEGCSVWRAKVGTYLDQVVDVFYVTDRDGTPLSDPAILARIKNRLLDVINRREE